MKWEAVVLLTWFGLAALVIVNRVGRPRKPITNGEAIGALCEVVVVSWLIVRLAS